MGHTWSSFFHGIEKDVNNVRETLEKLDCGLAAPVAHVEPDRLPQLEKLSEFTRTAQSAEALLRAKLAQKGEGAQLELPNEAEYARMKADIERLVQANEEITLKLEETEQAVWKLKWREAEERQRRVDAEDAMQRAQEAESERAQLAALRAARPGASPATVAALRKEMADLERQQAAKLLEATAIISELTALLRKDLAEMDNTQEELGGGGEAWAAFGGARARGHRAAGAAGGMTRAAAAAAAAAAGKENASPAAAAKGGLLSPLRHTAIGKDAVLRTAQKARSVQKALRFTAEARMLRGGPPKTFTAWLLEQERTGTVDSELTVLLSSIATACKRIANLVARAPVDGYLGLAGEANASGDEQKKLDVVANEVFCEAVRDSGRSAILVSEEEESPVALEAVSGNYLCAFDPIDGSSNIDAAIPTGSIFGVYTLDETCAAPEADEGPEVIAARCLLNARRAGNELAAAGYCMYSSSTVLVVTVRRGVYGFTLDRECGEFVLSHENLKIPDPGQKLYSGNLGNIMLWAPELRAYVARLQSGDKPHSYRYIGALVGDFHRTLLYGGIWLYPADTKAPSGKARLLYEVAPMSLIAEQAGGIAVCGADAQQRVLDIVPATLHQKSPLFVGSASEVRALQSHLAASGRA